MYSFNFIMVFGFITFSAPALFADENGASKNYYVRLETTESEGAELQLEARQAPLAKVLGEISIQTGMRINYSALPDGLLTATCVGSDVKHIFDCLLNNKADVVFRYNQHGKEGKVPRHPEEAWILGAKLVTGQEAVAVCAPSETRSALASRPEISQNEELIKMASSQNATERAEAMGRLLAEAEQDDVTVKRTLEAGLMDDDPLVRARALSSLAHREGENAAPALHQAMLDKAVSVRLTAVDNAGEDIGLLQQALTDNDPMVRQLATIRLKPLMKALGKE